MKKSILTLIIGIVSILTFFIVTVNANGLFINQTITNYTKVFGSDLVFNFVVINADSFNFYNISIEPNQYITTPIIPQLSPGQAVNISGIIVTNNSFDMSKFKIKAYYYANTGSTYKNYNVTVDYYSGLSRCDMSIIKGDKVTWVNNVADSIDLKNTDTGNIVTTILQGANYTTNFDSPSTFRYTFLRRGFVFTSLCAITALSDTGLINNPEYDGNLSIAVNVIYNPTTINATVLENNYSVDVYQTQDGVMTITNTGNQTARNILLSGDWFSFNTNNFNLEPGQTKGVVYTIRPILSNTIDTNKTYSKTLLINGNFQTVSKDFNLFVNFANLNSSNQSGNYQSLLALLQAFCKDNPTETFCQNKPSIVYVGNGTDQNFNVTYSTEQVKKIYDYIFSMGDDQRVSNNYMKETLANVSARISNIENITNSSLYTTANMENQRQISTGNTTLIIIMFILITLAGLMTAIIIVIKRHKNQTEINKW